MRALIAAGVCVLVFAAATLDYARLDMRFALLAAVTLVVGSRFSVPIPRTNGQISVTDTFVFLTMLLYDGEVAVLLAAADNLAASRYGTRRFSWRTSAFNMAMMACSTFTTIWVVRLLFGDLTALPSVESSATFVFALCVMGLVQYASNSVIAATHTSLKDDEPLWVTWADEVPLDFDYIFRGRVCGRVSG